MRTPLAEPAERGRLDIHPVVLRKIVEHAADGVPGTLRNERRLAGIDVGEYGASARVTVGTGEPAPVDVRLELTLRYPSAVRTVVDAVRTAVAEELDRLAGHRMRSACRHRHRAARPERPGTRRGCGRRAVRAVLRVLAPLLGLVLATVGVLVVIEVVAAWVLPGTRAACSCRGPSGGPRSRTCPGTRTWCAASRSAWAWRGC